MLSRELPGTWRLQSRVDVTADGARHPDPLLGEDPVALLYYDRAGHFAAQFMKRGDRSVTITAQQGSNNTMAQGGYDAYFGTYTVDDERGVVTQHLMGALTPANVGMTVSRRMELHGDTLVIALETDAADGTPITRKLTWIRVANETDGARHATAPDRAAGR